VIKLKDLVWSDVDLEDVNIDNAPAEENGLGGGNTVIMCCGGGGGIDVPPLRYWCPPPKY